MKKYLYFATALAMLASCTDTEFIGDQALGEANGQQAISFGFDVPAATRASGSAAADKLNNQFIVWGEKGETQTKEVSGETVAADGTVPSTGNLVFPNYKVSYGANTAYTTTSNTKDWEYVGLGYTSTEAANIKMGGTAVTTNDQTIKYWDYAASSYTFTAVSAKPADITDGKVIINKLTTGTTVYDKGYSITVTDDADLTSLYFADRVNVALSDDKDRTKSNKYGGNVQFTFRNGVSQVRVGMYETIPGYAVKVTKFYYQSTGSPTSFAGMSSNSTTNFVANVPNVSPASGKTSVPGTFTVKYYPQNTANDNAHITNHPTVSFTPSNSGNNLTYLTLGAGVYNTTLAETSATPTYDKTGGAFTTVFPQESNNVPMKLKIDYQLSNTVTGEIINITGKTAEVPAKYLQWKPNFRYTYLFKISDNDLYPITFDALTVEAEDGTVEYITTVSEPSITTYAKGSAVTTNDEYKSGETIYAVVEDGSNLATLTTDNMKLYTVTTTDATNFPITVGSVAEAIAEYPCLTTAERGDAKITFASSSFSYGKTVVGEDGSTVTMDASNNVVASFTPSVTANTVYAIEYVKTPATYSYDAGKNDYDATTFAAAGTLYTRSGSVGSYVYTVATTFADGTTYYKPTGVTNVGSYAYKIVKVKGVTP